MSRTGIPNYAERKLRRTLQEIVTAEQYEQIVKSLVSVAIEGKKDADRINAAKIIIDRIEGKLPDTVINQIVGSATVADLLGGNKE